MAKAANPPVKYDLGDYTIVLKNKFRSTHLARFREEAPELAEQLLDFFRDQMPDEEDGPDLEAMDEEEREAYFEEQEAEQSVENFRKMVGNSMRLTLQVSLTELQALHRLCRNLIKRVEGRDEVWANEDEEDQLDFLDLEVPSHIKFLIFVEAYMEKAGIYDEIEEVDDQDDTTDDG